MLPPPRVTYDDWIICQGYFNQPQYTKRRNEICSDGKYSNVQWSPRRHHASVVFKGFIYVFGGRARELVEYPEARSVGGIIGPRVLDPTSRTIYTTQRLTKAIHYVHGFSLMHCFAFREASVYKNDVWKSADGKNWILVTPGKIFLIRMSFLRKYSFVKDASVIKHLWPLVLGRCSLIKMLQSVKLIKTVMVRDWTSLKI